MGRKKKKELNPGTFVWAHLPGLPSLCMWPVRVEEPTLLATDLKTKVYCRADNAIFLARNLESFQSGFKYWKAKGQQAFRKKPETLKMWLDDIKWAEENESLKTGLDENPWEEHHGKHADPEETECDAEEKEADKDLIDDEEEGIKADKGGIEAEEEGKEADEEGIEADEEGLEADEEGIEADEEGSVADERIETDMVKKHTKLEMDTINTQGGTEMGNHRTVIEKIDSGVLQLDTEEMQTDSDEIHTKRDKIYLDGQEMHVTFEAKPTDCVEDEEIHKDTKEMDLDLDKIYDGSSEIDSSEDKESGNQAAIIKEKEATTIKQQLNKKREAIILSDFDDQDSDRFMSCPDVYSDLDQNPELPQSSQFSTCIIPNSEDSEDSDVSDVYPMMIPRKRIKISDNKHGCKELQVSSIEEDSLETGKNNVDTNPRNIAKDVSNPAIFVALVSKREFSNSGKRKKTKRVYDSKHPCAFCDKIVSNFSHHILTKSHEQEDEVKLIKEEADEKSRKKLITKLRLKAAHDHNLAVLKAKKGEIFLLRRSQSVVGEMEEHNETDEEDDDLQQNLDVGKYGPCPKCLGWILQKSIKRHMKTCTSELPLTGSKGSLILQSDILLGKIPDGASQALTLEVFPIMQVDEVSNVAKNDELIINLGNQWMMRNRGNQIMRKYYTSSTMRLSAKMKMGCQALTKNSTATMDNFLKPSCFDHVLKASLNCCNVDEMDEENLNAPSNAIKLGHDIKRMLSAKLAQSIRNGDERKMKEAEEFRKLMEIEWGLRVAKLARSLLAERSFNSERKLPLPEDVKKLASFLRGEINDLQLDDTSFSNFKKAAILTLARITLFNRRRCHEVQAMKLTSYAARKTGIDSVGEELRGELTKFESHLLHSQEMVVIRGKTGRGVPVILPRDVKESLCFLADPNVRRQAGIQSNNQYMFANAGAGVFRAYDSIREVTRDPKAGLLSPDLIRTSNMRKYMATMVQAMSTDDAEKQWIIDHLGHTMNVHTVHYRQTSDVLERVDIAKILLIQDFGLVGKFRGKKLQEIQLDDIMEVTQDRASDRAQDAVQDPQRIHPEIPPEPENVIDEIDEDYIPDLAEMDQLEEEDCEPVNKIRKTPRPSTRQKWTVEEEKELKSLFKHDLDADKLPGQKRIEEVMRLSKQKQGTIHLRKRDNIKKKLSNMMMKTRKSKHRE